MDMFCGSYSDVSNIYPDLAELKSLLAGLALPRQNQTEAATSSPEDIIEIGSPIRAGSFWSFTQLAPIYKKLQRHRSVEGKTISLYPRSVQKNVCIYM